MLAESVVATALSPVLPAKVFPDVAPAATAAPWITYQAVGGQAFATIDGETPGTLNARMQVTVWSKTRLQTGNIMQQVFQALVNPAVKAVPIGAPVSTFEPDTLLYGSTLDFSVTYSG
ncbi:DUF3168 domain-containing protein [Burkholderia vietnamiensis]|uniref:DUF3168 domain-containing protein n=1 Tax=Burkholderia vietnamiensis TaxID=60552 RepID=UPI001E29F3F5|nr:DUF3168 domain-containing protein [Burkholderia vietnamiensis]